MPNAAKNFFRLIRGLNTDASPIEFPEGFSADEQNYDLLIDGSRRRRKGLELEAGGEVLDMSTTKPDSEAAYVSYKWQNAGSVPQNDFVVIQTGRYLRFFLDEHPVSANAFAFSVDLNEFAIGGAALADIEQSPVCMSSGRGHLFVSGPYTESFFVDYSENTGEISTTAIHIVERDFEGINDGYSDTAQPSTQEASHIYNLMNRGWTPEFIQDYLTDINVYPAKNMIPWLGLKRTLTSSNYYDEDGIRVFAPDKLVAELFQDATAPMGHFLRDPFDTTAVSMPGADVQFAITNWTINNTSPTPQPKVITVTTAGAHGLSPSDTVRIFGQSSSYLTSNPPDTRKSWSFNGTSRTVLTTPTSTTFTINASGPSSFDNWDNGQYRAMGTVSVSSAVNPGGFVATRRPKANAFFAGRVFYAGTDYGSLATKIFFSQVIEADAQYGKCYQVADPTDERISDLVATDGGVIVIPEVADVQCLLPYGASLLVFAYNGVWQIGPGEGGYFSANSYSIRKITEMGCAGARTVVLAEGTPLFWSINDIYAIVQDENTGFLVPRNLSLGKITTFYSGISMPHRLAAQGTYDDVSKTVSWLHSIEGEGGPYDYRRMLSLDQRFGAFIPHKFGVEGEGRIVTSFTVLVPPPQGVPRLRIVSVDTDGEALTLGTLTDTTFMDLGSQEQPAYILTAYDSAGDPATKQTTPFVHVFSRKTEIGFTQAGNQYTPIGASSTLMQARWDWSDNSVAGRWGTPQEVYRRARLYIPSDPNTDTFADGVPLVVTRNLVRGRGRTLQLLFKAGPGKDSWLQGFKVYYNKARM